jgi:uncharacterized glyoxalase superfamily protein PhnB
MSSRPHALIPHLFVRDMDAAIAFYRKAFGAVELFRNVLPDGTMLFVGEWYGVVVDPSGHRWALSTRREELTPDDIVRHAPPDA